MASRIPRLAFGGPLWSCVLLGLGLAACAPDGGNGGLEPPLPKGSLAVSVTGLPDGAPAEVQVTGPGGFARTATATELLKDLNPGTYTLSAAPVESSGDTWTPASTSQSLTVSAGAVTGAAVNYKVSTGRLAVTISGLPSGTAALVSIRGPRGFNQRPQASQTYTGLAPGSYTIEAQVVTANGSGWNPAPLSQSVNVSASTTEATASVAYSLSTGRLTVTLAGLPSGTSGSATITGPGGFAQTINATTTVNNLVPGAYVITAPVVNVAGAPWQPSPATQQINVPASVAPASASVTWSQGSGSLALTVSGLPGGANANITVTGPGGFSRSLTATTTINGLVPGSYTVAASSVSSGGTTYAPSPASQSRSVSAGATATASVAYTGSGGGGGSLNLRIDGLYVTQAAQRYDGTAPLVAGRDGYLRVFVRANQANSAQPQVRVRLYSSGTLVQTYTINAPASSAPTSVNEGSLTASWNVLIPAPLMQPNLTVLADVDPGGVLAESDEGDNAFPASGTPGAVDVRTLPTWNVRFVPVLQSVNSLQGNVTTSNTSSFLTMPLTLLPVGAHNADVRAAYTTTAPALANDNANGAWGTILSEILALRSSDASTRYYYGVVKTTYSSGVAGMGYVGGGARTAIGWDRLPSASEVMAHEVGHNMGRNHAACGGAGGPDANYPYSGGSIGIWGLDIASLQLKSPSAYYDLMGYCSPKWISDYNWSAMLTYRQGGPNNTVGRSDRLTVGPGLLVWGRITSSGLVLEPAFVVDNADLSAPPVGPHLVEARDASGQVLFSIPFAANEATDMPTGREEAFAFVVPASRALAADIAELRLVSGGASVTRRPAPAAPSAAFTRAADGRGLLTWNAAAHPVVMVRDGATGQILSFARGGSVRLPAGATSLDATFSDGTRSSRVLLNRQ